MSDMSVHNPETGEYLGEMHIADDGAHVLVNPAGEVIAAVDADHNELDINNYTVDDPNAQFAEEIQELRAQLEAQEQQTNAQDTNALQTHDQISVDLAHQSDHMRRVLGRDLTLTEAKRLADKTITQTEAGRLPDVLEAAQELADEGRPLLDMDDPTERVQFMTERLQLKEREARGENVTDPEPRSHDLYDLDDPTERQAWMTDRAEGRLTDEEAHAVTYNSSDDTDA